MNARRKAQLATQNKKNINVLVRVTAAVVAILLVFYFVVTLNNLSNITQSVEERKEETYPISIAAGHIETSLARMLSIMQMVLALEPDSTLSSDFEGNLTFDNVSELPQVDQSLGRSRYFDAEYIEQISRGNNQEIRNQMSILTSERFKDEANIQELAATLDSIFEELEDVFEFWGQDPGRVSLVQERIDKDVVPKIEHAIVIDNAIIGSTTEDIEDLYNGVLEAIQQTILFSIILIVGIFIAIFIYVSLLSRKEEYEQELSGHLKDALALAQNANAAKSTFLSNMSHDIRTPLNAIIGLSAIAEDSIDDPAKTRRCLTQINASSHHLLDLVNDVLDVNRIESGKTILSKEVFSLSDLISELSAINEPQINEKKLKAEFILKNVRHEQLVGDPVRIRQVLLNLTNNAIKYSDPGGSLTVTAEEYKSTRVDYANLRFTVSDTGIGIEPEFLQYIFEPFEREHNKRTSHVEGTGLGMAIAKNLVTMMGGTIRVESQVGEGSTFTVEVALRIAGSASDFGANVGNELQRDSSSPSAPLNDGPDVSSGNTPNSEGASTTVIQSVDSQESQRRISMQVESSNTTSTISGNASDSNGTSSQPTKETLSQRAGRVLIVEDNELNMEIATELVEKCVCQVDQAFNGQEALDLIKGKPEGYYDLIFMDWQMPVMDGIEATKAIIRHFDEQGYVRTPIVAMTANAFSDNRREAMAAGMEGFMVKPIDIKELRQYLAKYCHSGHSGNSEI